MTAQEVFDTVVQHLIDQGSRCTTPSGYCLYRTDDGRKCAIGCLLDEPHLELALHNGGDIIDIRTILPQELRQHYYLLQRLQRAHDAKVREKCPTAAAGELRKRLRHVAKRGGLSDKLVEDLKSWTS